MANHKSAAKRARQSVRRQAINSTRKSVVKTAEKNLVKAIAAKDLKAVPELLKNYVAQIYKAAQKGVLKKETASRKVSRLSTKAGQTLSAK